MEPIIVLMPYQLLVPHSLHLILVLENSLITKNVLGLINLVLPMTLPHVEAYWTKLHAQPRTVNGAQLVLCRLVLIRQHQRPVI